MLNVYEMFKNQIKIYLKATIRTTYSCANSLEKEKTNKNKKSTPDLYLLYIR